MQFGLVPGTVSHTSPEIGFFWIRLLKINTLYD